MNDWTSNLERLRLRELAIAFGTCPDKLFPRALELGAGAGFQSRALVRYVQHLVSTDFNAARLQRTPAPGIEYRICDAEEIGGAFEPGSFELVFASNLFEHLPNPEKALAGIREVLAPDGIVILIMPNMLWKAFSLVGFYPNALRLLWRGIKQGRLQSLWRRYIAHTARTDTLMPGNNLKSSQPVSPRAGVLWPVPHGAYGTHRDEFRQFRRRRWLQLFTETGFKVITVRNGPVSSGYGFGLTRSGRLLERIGLTTEYIYILKEKSSGHAYADYFK